MSRDVGILRDGIGLEAANADLVRLDRSLRELEGTAALPTAELARAWGESRNIVLIARLVTFAALRRTESRGAHYRRDFPQPSRDWRHPQSITIDTLQTESAPDSLPDIAVAMQREESGYRTGDMRR